MASRHRARICIRDHLSPAEGYLGFIPDADGAAVEVSVLTSTELTKKWREIDDFEGEGYERQRVVVTLESGALVDAEIYVALTDV